MSEGDNKDRALPISAILLALAALSVIIFNRTPFQDSRPAAPDVGEPTHQIKAKLWEDPFQAVIRGEKGAPAGIPRFLSYTSNAPLALLASKTEEAAEPAKEKQPEPAKEKQPEMGQGKPSEPEKGKPSLPAKGGQLEATKAGKGNPSEPGRGSTEPGQAKLSGPGKGTPEPAQTKPSGPGKEQAADPTKVTAVAVMVFGQTFADQDEIRIRQRYAALSAFKRLGLIPEDPEHISYIKMVNSPQDRATDIADMTNIIPFERLRHERSGRTILLLWLNDDVFQKEPLKKLNRLSNCLKEAGTFKVIGPAGSTTLKAMIDDVKDTKFTRPVEIYSATATADYPELYDLLQKKQDVIIDGQSQEFFFGDKNRNCTFKRTVCSDRQLADKIRSELCLRGIDCKDKRNHIVLISEWDTPYGRSVQDLYRSVFFQEGDVNIGSQLHFFSYIRGIDGKLPGGEESREKGDNETQAKALQVLERPEGMGQLDYLRRLADEMYRFERHLDVDGRIRAIGVLGTDFHDKYLVLQAMRQRFPQAVLFTTDLDARLLHPDALKWSRNLVVASSYNLGLRNDVNIDIQSDLPPFRDSFQTSIFISILQALGKKAPSLDFKVRDVVMQEPQAKVFEIGRYRAVDLSEDPNNVRTFNPRYTEAESSKKLLQKIIMLALITSLLLSLCSEKVRTLITSAFTSKKSTAATLAGVALLALCVWLFYQFILLRPHLEEPFSFVEGVSTWPAEILRCLAIILSVFFMRQSYLKSKSNTAAICEEFGFHYVSPNQQDEPDLPARTKDRTGIVGDLTRMFGKFSEVVRYDWDIKPTPGEEVQVDDYWNEYCRRDSWYFRVRRLTPIILTYVLLCALIISFEKPIAPVRGVISTIIDTVLMQISVITFTILVFSTFDIIRNCRRLIRLLVLNVPAWSEKSFDKVLGSHTEGSKTVMKEWMLVHFIARRTSTVNNFVLYPFIVWSVILVTRLHYFDNWQMPVGLLVVVSLGALYAWSCAYVLRGSAEDARKSALGRLAGLQAAVCAKSERDEDQLKRIEAITETVRSTREGAFAPFSQNPVVQALLVPFGAGGVYILQFIAKLKTG